MSLQRNQKQTKVSEIVMFGREKIYCTCEEGAAKARAI